MKLAVTRFTLALLVCPFQEPALTPQGRPPIRVDVSLVTLTATVFDRKDRPVPDLEKSDFAIYEDSVSQEIAFFQREENPVSVGILFDTSGSMVDKIDEVRDVVIHFVNTSNPEDDIFLMPFSSEAFLVQDFTSDRQLLARAIGSLHAAGSRHFTMQWSKGCTASRRGGTGRRHC